MKALYKRTFFLTILIIMFIFRPVYLPSSNHQKAISKASTLKVLLVKNTAQANSAIISNSDLKFYPGLDSHINILTIIATWKFIFSTLFEFQLLILDMRKRILTLITNFFQGSKYKDSFSLA